MSHDQLQGTFIITLQNRLSRLKKRFKGNPFDELLQLTSLYASYLEEHIYENQ
jgi:hypothetical protein